MGSHFIINLRRESIMREKYKRNNMNVIVITLFFLINVGRIYSSNVAHIKPLMKAGVATTITFGSDKREAKKLDLSILQAQNKPLHKMEVISVQLDDDSKKGKVVSFQRSTNYINENYFHGEKQQEDNTM